MLPQLHFEEKRALAGGIATAGYSLGYLVLPYTTEVLLEAYGWRGTLVILAAFLVQLLPIVSMFRSPSLPPQSSIVTQHNNIENDKSLVNKAISAAAPTERDVVLSRKKISGSSLLCKPVFSLFIAGTFLVNIGLYTVIGMSVLRARYMGFSEADTALVGSCFGFGGFVIRFLMLLPLSTEKVNLLAIYALGQLLGGILLIILAFVTSLIGTLVCTAMYGMSFGEYQSAIKYYNPAIPDSYIPTCILEINTFQPCRQHITLQLVLCKYVYFQTSE